jgi:hypothetical protein
MLQSWGMKKAKFKAGFRKYLHTHFFYSVDEFCLWEDDLWHRFCKMLIVFYTVNVYICVFMTFSTSCCLYGTIMDLWNVCIYTYICVCVRVYVRMYCTQWELWSIFVLGVVGVGTSVTFHSTHGQRPHKLQCLVEIPSVLWMLWCLCLTFS